MKTTQNTTKETQQEVQQQQQQQVDISKMSQKDLVALATNLSNIVTQQQDTLSRAVIRKDYSDLFCHNTTREQLAFKSLSETKKAVEQNSEQVLKDIVTHRYDNDANKKLVSKEFHIIVCDALRLMRDEIKESVTK